MFKIIFKIADFASKEIKRDFNIDQILEDSEKKFDDITEYNQYVQVIERIFEKNQKLNLYGNDYSINDLKTITTSNLSNIILEVTVIEFTPPIDWDLINKELNSNNNWYFTYGTGTTNLHGNTTMGGGTQQLTNNYNNAV